MNFFRRKDHTAQLKTANLLLKSAREASQQDRKAEALDQLRQAADIAASVGKLADDVRYAATFSSASIFILQNRLDEAQAALDTATEIIVANKWNYSLRHFEVMFYSSKVFFEKGDLTGAVSVLMHAQEQLSKRANSRDLHRCLAQIHENLVNIHLRQRHFVETLKWLTVAQQHAQRFGKSFPFVWSRIFFAETNLCLLNGCPEGEVNRLCAAAGFMEQTVGAGHAALALVQAGLATLLQNVGAVDESEALFEKVRGELRLESGLQAQGMVWRGLGMHQLRRQNYVEAESLFRRAMESKTNGLGLNRSLALNNLGVAIREQGRLSEAEPLFREAIALAESSGDLGRFFHWANAMKNLGRNCQLAGQMAEAAGWYRSALDKFAEASQADARVAVKAAETRELLASLNGL
jgi:tetratricopeptide (TPR) repeat protein